MEHAVAEFRGTVIKLKNAGDLVLWLLLLVITSLPQIMTVKYQQQTKGWI